MKVVKEKIEVFVKLYRESQIQIREHNTWIHTNQTIWKASMNQVHPICVFIINKLKEN